MCQMIIYLLCFRFNHNCCAWFAGLRLMPGSTGHLWLREVLEAVPHVEPGARGNRGNGDTTSRAKKSETFPYIERDGNVAWYGKTNGTVEEIYGDVVFFFVSSISSDPYCILISFRFILFRFVACNVHAVRNYQLSPSSSSSSATPLQTTFTIANPWGENRIDCIVSLNVYVV